MSGPPKALIAWSSGKDSAWALHEVRLAGTYDVVGALTTVTDAFGRVSIHGLRRELLAAQLDAAGLAAVTVHIPYPCPNEIYEREMASAMEQAKARGVTHVIFGDLFLEDVRAYSQQIVASGAASHGIALESGFDSGGGWYMEQWLCKAGEFYTDQDNGRTNRATRVLFDNQAGVDLLTFLRQMVVDGLAVNVGDNATTGFDNLLKLADDQQPAAMTIARSGPTGLSRTATPVCRYSSNACGPVTRPVASRRSRRSVGTSTRSRTGTRGPCGWAGNCSPRSADATRRLKRQSCNWRRRS